MNKRKLVEQCTTTLKQNDLGTWTRPAPGLYPNQWLWDSCFIAIGLRHIDANRAKTELTSMLHGQWKNGMVPHVIISPDDYFGKKLWGKASRRQTQNDIITSAITQPPMLTEAFVRVGEKLKKTERQTWYKHHINQLIAYHEWLYRERDPQSTGLVALIHPWESGIDNSPSWMSTIYSHPLPVWINLLEQLQLDGVMQKLRRDTKLVPAGERIATKDGLLLYHHIKDVIHSNGTLKHSTIALQDVLFNSILIRANQHLETIANEIGITLPSWLITRMKKATSALHTLWDETSQFYYDKNYSSGALTGQLSIGRYLPLYTGTISNSQARKLAAQLQKELTEAPYAVASVPISDPYFNGHRYWQGPAWVNTNWLIIDGLQRYGFFELAETIRARTLELIERYGPHEYFSPIDGTPAGAHQFSWSAALAIDLANQ